MSQIYEPTESEFGKEVANGTMEILRDDVLYRHLRFRLPAGGVSWFDIVTWPGRLVITGDCDTYAFARLVDMFEFFRVAGDRINPGYWQEKILDGRDRARRFDWDRFRAQALAEFDKSTAGRAGTDLHADARQDLQEALDAADHDEWGSVQLLRDYQYQADGIGATPYFYFDLSDGPPDGMGWDFHYIWCCRAIAWAIQQYDKHYAAAGTAEEQRA